MYTGFRRLATEDKVKKVGGKHFHESNHSVVPVLPDKDKDNKPDLESAYAYGNRDQDFIFQKYKRDYCLSDDECKYAIGKDFSCGYYEPDEADQAYYRHEGFTVTNDRIIDGICRTTGNAVY